MPSADDALMGRPRIIVDRTELRRPLKAEARIRNVESGQFGGRLIDISEHGCKIELFDIEASPGQKITIKLENLEVWIGFVMWVRGSSIGVSFERPMHSAVVDHLSRSHPSFELR